MTLELRLPVTEYKTAKVKRRIETKAAQIIVKGDGIDAAKLDYGVIRTNSGLVYVGRYEGKNRNGI